MKNTYSPVAKMSTLKLLLSYCCQNSLEIEQMDVETAFLNGKVLSEVYVKLFGNVVNWKSKKQIYVTKSSMFAKYNALSKAVTEINLLINISNDVLVKICNPVKIYKDNSGALSIANYGNFSKNSKHIEVNNYYVHESYKIGIIEIVKIDTNNKVADIFTNENRSTEDDEYSSKEAVYSQYAEKEEDSESNGESDCNIFDTCSTKRNIAINFRLPSCHQQHSQEVQPSSPYANKEDILQQIPLQMSASTSILQDYDMNILNENMFDSKSPAALLRTPVSKPLCIRKRTHSKYKSFHELKCSSEN
ncbi:unnamed protein product [Euphydryas editha]|uniref:Reverse transcriptase Ty1/copia-type domain-containing protein n=1 Tax=Euphydryas editha TaxID=104508 RepID=A0AAU9TTB8_EUPED|nr:unnamed protein product [Euphydryas editha]